MPVLQKKRKRPRCCLDLPLSQTSGLRGASVKLVGCSNEKSPRDEAPAEPGRLRRGHVRIEARSCPRACARRCASALEGGSVSFMPRSWRMMGCCSLSMAELSSNDMNSKIKFCNLINSTFFNLIYNELEFNCLPHRGSIQF